VKKSQYIHRKLVPVRRVSSIAIFSVLLLVFCSMNYAIDQTVERLNVSVSSHEGGYLTILTYGNKLDRKASVSVFEIFGNDRKIRQLFVQELHNQHTPRERLFYGGRFLITLEEWRDSTETPFALVVYDLVLGKSTSFRLSDLFEQATLDELPLMGGIGGVKWQDFHYPRENYFNQSKLEFYINPPHLEQRLHTRNGDDVNDKSKCTYYLPFVVVDLRTRTTRIEPDRSNLFVMREKDKKDQLYWRCCHKQDDSIGFEDSSELLPRILKCELRSREGQLVLDGTNDVYELDINRREYRIASSQLWEQRIRNPGESDELRIPRKHRPKN
jgi:hypothetical protein